MINIRYLTHVFLQELVTSEPIYTQADISD
jgi:hypothetical protein